MRKKQRPGHPAFVLGWWCYYTSVITGYPAGISHGGAGKHDWRWTYFNGHAA